MGKIYFLRKQMYKNLFVHLLFTNQSETLNSLRPGAYFKG